MGSQPAIAAGGIKPGVKRSETPGSSITKIAEPAERPIADAMNDVGVMPAAGRFAGWG